EGPRLHRREPDGEPGPAGARGHRRDEPSLLFGALPEKRGPLAPSICPGAENRTRQEVPSKPEALRPRGRFVGRIREPQLLRARVSKVRGQDPETVPSGLTGQAAEGRMDKPRIFLGSSGKQAKLVEALTSGLDDVARVDPWTTSFN